MKTIFLIALFSLSSPIIFAQIEPVTGLHYIDNGRFDSMFRKNYKNDIASTYFLITINPILSSLTLAPEVIKAYQQMRKFDADIPLYIVYINQGVVSSTPGDEERYFKDIFYIDKKKDKNVHIIQSDTLYYSLNVLSIMTKWFYVYHSRLVAGATSIKLHDLNEYHHNLPKDFIAIGKPKKIKLLGDSMHLSTFGDLLRPYKPDKLFYITDMNNNLYVLDVNSGRFVKSFDKKSFDFVDFYCKHISKSDSDCQIAKLHLKEYGEDKNRDQNFFANAFYTNGNIYVGTGFEIPVPWESTVYAGTYLYYTDELGEKEKVRESVFGQTFPALLKLDTSLNLISASYINTYTSYPPENRAPKEGGFWTAYDKGFFIRDSLIFLDNNPNFSKVPKKMPKVADHAFSAFKLGNGRYNFNKFLPIQYDKDYLKYNLNWHCRTFYFEVKNKLYGTIDNGGYICSLNGDNETYKLKGDGRPLIKEHVPDFDEDTSWLKLNYRTLYANSIFNGRYAVAIYFYQDRPTMEVMVLDTLGRLKTIQVTDLSNMIGFSTLQKGSYKFPYDGDGMCISDNNIYLSHFENGEYFLYEYPLSMIYRRHSATFKRISRKK